MPMYLAMPAGLTVGDLQVQLQTNAQGSVLDDATVTMIRTYFDTFDWRLYKAHSTIRVTAEAERLLIEWLDLKKHIVLGDCVMEQTPQFVWDFPPVSLREQLTGVLEMRALLPLVKMQSKLSTLRILNDDGKTVVRLVHGEHRLLPETDDPSQPFTNTIEIVPLRGYAKAAKRIQRQLLELGLEPPPQHPLLMALAALGKEPGDYSSKLSIPLLPQMRAEEATKRILLHLLDTIERNEPGTRADLDSEFLHDFRVAVRRMRSALTQIKGVLPDEQLSHYREGFRWLGRVTGPTRDLDVYLLKFDDYRAELPPTIRADLTPLYEFLLAHQKEAHGELVTELTSTRYATLVKNWRTFLETPITAATMCNDDFPPPPNAALPIIDVANARIWRVYRRVLKEGGAITPTTPAAALHDLRITCKKLRYLMEFFQSLYPPREIKQRIGILKVLQNNLGDFQDYEVQAHKLREFAQQMMDEGKTPAVTLMAMGILVEHLAESQAETRLEFAERFRQFAHKKNRSRFKALFANRTKSQPSAEKGST